MREVSLPDRRDCRRAVAWRARAPGV